MERGKIPIGVARVKRMARALKAEYKVFL